MLDGVKQLRKRLRLPFWHKADIEAELASHLQEAAAGLTAEGMDKAEAERTALERFGDLDSLAECLQAIHHGWIGGATVQTRLARVVVAAVIGLCILAIPAVPPLRQAAREVAFRRQPYPSKERIERAARNHPGNVYIQLALAENAIAPLRTPPSDPALRRSYAMKPDADLVFLRGVVSQFPKSPAAHLQFALRLIARSGPLHREELWGGHDPYEHYPRTQEQEEHLSEAIRHLRIAARLDPKNAAPDFLLAYALFAKKQDQQADQTLRAALAKPSWATYLRETRETLLTLYEDSGVSSLMAPITVITAHTTEALMLQSYERSLARILTGLAEHSVRNDEAIFYYQAAIHLGHVLLNGADSLLDGLTAAAINHIVSGKFISPEEKKYIKQTRLPVRQKMKLQAEIRNRHFQAYLVSRGRTDLARAYSLDSRRAGKFTTEARSITERMMPTMMAAFSSRYVLLAMVGWASVSYALTLLILVGLLSLLTRSWKAGGTAPAWRWREWAILIALAIGPCYLGATVYFPVYEKELVGQSLEKTLVGGIFLGVAAIVAALLLLLVPIIGGLLKRRRQPPEERMGKFQAVLASFRILLTPTFALVLLLALLFSVPALTRLRQWTDEQGKIIQQGEVEYWKIGE